MPDEFSVSDMESRKRRMDQGVEAAGFSPADARAPGAVAERGLLPFTHVGSPATEGVDVLQYARVLLHRWLWIALCVIVFMGAAAAYVKWWPPTYATSGQYRVDTPGSLILEGSTSRQRLQRIAELARAQEVRSKVLKEMGLDRLPGTFSTSIDTNAGFLTLRVAGRSRDRLQEVIETTVRAFNIYIREEQYDKRHMRLTQSIRRKRALLDLMEKDGKCRRKLDATDERLESVALNLTTEQEMIKRIDAQIDIIARTRPLSSTAALRLIDEETARIRIEQHELSKRYKAVHPKMQHLETRLEALKELQEEYLSEASPEKPGLKIEHLSSMRFKKVLLCDKLAHQRTELTKKRSELDKTLKDLATRITRAEEVLRFRTPSPADETGETTGKPTTLPEPSEGLPVTPEALARSLSSDLSQLNRAIREGEHDVLVPIHAPGPAKQIWPQGMRILLLGLLAGLVTGVALALLADHLDDRILTPTTVVRSLGLNLLVIAPRFRDPRERLIDLQNPSSTLAEIFGILRNNIRYTSEANPQKLLLISSAQQGEGKSTVAANLALSYQLEGNSVLLVDADLRRPTGHRLLEGLMRTPNPQPGLRQWLEGEVDESARIIHTTSVDSLCVIPAGGRARNPAKLLGAARMQQILDTVQNDFDVVIIDGPAVLPVVDATVISNRVRGVLMVVSARESRLPSVRHAMGRLQHVGSPIIGAILNKFEGSSNVYSHYYGYGYRGYQYSYSPYREET